ncbi:MAG: LuxR C-terminal-related transcriptional regulator [Nitrospira sp.]|nr:response regulator [Nitrospira sp.]
MSKIRIMLVEDIQANREWVRSLNKIAKTEVTLEVIKEAKNGKEAITYLECNAIRPDVVLMDIEFKELGRDIHPNGLDTTKIIFERYPTITTLILSVYDDLAYVRQAFQCGAQGYFLKDGETGIAELCEAIVAVWNRKYFVSPIILKRLIEIVKVAGDGNDRLGLTPKEFECAPLYAEKKTAREIAEKMNIVPRTVESYITSIRSKLNASSPEEVRQRLRENVDRVDRLGLIARQFIVAVLYAQELTCEEIAKKWNIPVRTVEADLSVVRRKLNVSSSQEVKQRLMENRPLPLE